MGRQRAFVWTAFAGLTAALLGAVSSAQSQSTSAQPACRLPEGGHQVLQGALDGWAWVRRELLRLGPTPLPWVVLFDEECSWHLSPDPTLTSSMTPSDQGLSFDGERLTVLTAPHDGSVELPNGVTVGPRAIASTSVYSDGSRAFSVISEFGVWRRDPRHAKDPRLGEFYQGLVLHELTHTVQLVAISRRLLTIRKMLRLPSGVDDDIVQKRFAHLQRLGAAIDAERKVLYQAVLATDVTKRRQLTSRALTMARERRARFFKGISSGYAELEDIFFTMEGVSQFAVFRWALSRASPGRSEAAVLDFVRADRAYWSQDEGLALFLLIDKLLPNWQTRVLGDDIPSPFALIEEGLERS